MARVKERNPPVLTPFLEVGIEKYTGTNTRPMHPKQGSVTWAVAGKRLYYEEYPDGTVEIHITQAGLFMYDI